MVTTISSSPLLLTTSSSATTTTATSSVTPTSSTSPPPQQQHQQSHSQQTGNNTTTITTNISELPQHGGEAHAPQYHYITTTTSANGEITQHTSTTPTTIVYEPYEGEIIQQEGGSSEVGSTIIKFEGGEYEVIKNEINDNNIIQTNNNNNQHHQHQQQHQQQQQQEVVVKYEDQSLDDDSYEEFQSVSSPQKEQQQNVTYQTITHHDKETNQIITETIVIPASGSNTNNPVVLSSGKQKRKRKTRSVCADEQGEYLEKMSVRGLDIQRYEHIIDGVSYCLVCAKNDIYKTFKNKYSFQRHAYLFHEGDNRKIFACPICNKEFSRPDKMKMHKKDKHGDMAVPEAASGGGTPVKNNSDTPPPAKRARNSAVKTPRARKPRSSLASTIDIAIPNKDAAVKKRLAQIDSVLDEVQNADSNQSNGGGTSGGGGHTPVHIQQTTIIQPAHQPQQQTTQQSQQLPSLEFSGMILPGGAQLALANPGATSSIMQPQAQRVLSTQPSQNHSPGTATLIYSNQIDLQQALLQQQLHGQSIMIQDQAGNLVPLQSLQSLDGSQTIYTTTAQAPPPPPNASGRPQQIIQTQQQSSPHHQTLLTTAPTQNTTQHIKVEQNSTTAAPQQQTNTTTTNNTTSHNTQQQTQQQHYELENVAYLSSTAATPTATALPEQHVIGTVQSYQILTPDGLQSYQAATKLEPNELELGPYTMATTTPHYTFSSHLTSSADPSLHPHHHQAAANNNGGHHQTTIHHHQTSQQQQHHHHHQLQQSHHQTTTHHHHALPSLSAPHHQFMELKNDLLIKSTDAYSLDAATSMYHLPFSPTSMINAVSDVNSSSLLETKEIR